VFRCLTSRRKRVTFQAEWDFREYENCLEWAAWTTITVAVHLYSGQ